MWIVIEVTNNFTDFLLSTLGLRATPIAPTGFGWGGDNLSPMQIFNTKITTL